MLIGLALILAAAFVCARIARRVGQPAVMGEIIAGIALGPSLLGLLPGNVTDALFPADARPLLQALAQLGLVLFMFGVGYELDLFRLRGAGRQVIAISLSSVTLPFALGSTLALLLYPWYDKSQLSTSGVLAPALFLGAAMAITAFPVLARIIAERGMQRTRIGALAVTCAAIEDVIAWCVLAVIVVIATAGGTGPLVRMLLESGAFLLVILYVVRPGLRWLMDAKRRWVASNYLIHAVLVSGLLLSAWATNEIGLHAVFGGFAFGAVVPREEIDARAPEVAERIEQTSLFLLPVFFTVTGLSVNIGGLGGQGVVVVVAVILVACAGKFAGATVSARLSGATWPESATLGVLLNARGLTELVILNVGLELGVLDNKMFTAMVIMALVTTFMTGPLLRRLRPRQEDHPIPVPTASARRPGS
ncbi:Kef-type K+ transport system membrane component KefB [Streptomyces sp. SAI-135]|jgi:Kef-type K+ transport system membrane component KefB|uniref:cation:proton antiporter n=1 Tax=unclassified Streptomyces TaxID=2593676 RepID=UPI0024731624|nr:MULTISPECIES: cation:proton antiporter [unclassified Streptomyces]MDH6521878.1 Kef-type K+ transport system membrane component KefB [Streptomyces sp. SAI-090]MDH6573244.1 Kef-type K+ transport system membrane component KefB [Streptomyces sp. SAI-117]MDH6614021.1 Kef-type K+ transport system membrane component KefB [Streptomyces sp. SAI-135]